MSTTQATGSSVQEYVIRVPKNVKKKYQVMRFNSSVNVDFGKWTQVKMERENNMKEFKGLDEDQPKFGAGSEFGRDAREEARRKKYGIVSRKYRPDDQPWILKAGGKTGKKFRGIREGGVAENAAYYVFTHAPDGAIDAFPLQEWYNFQPIQRYKALSAEEAEQEFGRRNKHLNFFSLMLRKRLRGEDDGDVEDPEEMKGKKGGSKKKELKISEMDDWIDSDDESDLESEDEKEKTEEKEEEKEKEKKTKKKGEAGKKKKKKKDSDDEAFEESDDGDEEGREVDYISDSSDSDSDHEGKVNKQMQGVAEEESLRKLLSSGEEDDDDPEKQDADKDSEAEEKEKNKADSDKPADKDKKGTTSGGTKKIKKKKKKQLDASKKIKKEDAKVIKESSSDFSSDSTDSEAESKKKDNKDGTKGSKESNSGGSSRSATPTKEMSGDGKRKASSTPEGGSSKKARLDNFASATLTPYAGDSGITEDAVRRYLMRKPMTTTELLQKFKSKKTGLSSDQLVNIMTQILKRINPVKQTIKGKMYLSIKA